MTLGAAGTAGACESAFDLGVGTFGLVVTNFATVEAFSSHLARFGTIAGKVARLAAAAKASEETWKMNCANDLLAAGVIASIVLGDHFRIDAGVNVVRSGGISSAFDPSGSVDGYGFLPGRG